MKKILTLVFLFAASATELKALNQKELKELKKDKEQENRTELTTYVGHIDTQKEHQQFIKQIYKLKIDVQELETATENDLALNNTDYHGDTPLNCCRSKISLEQLKVQNRLKG